MDENKDGDEAPERADFLSDLKKWIEAGAPIPKN